MITHFNTLGHYFDAFLMRFEMRILNIVQGWGKDGSLRRVHISHELKENISGVGSSCEEAIDRVSFLKL